MHLAKPSHVSVQRLVALAQFACRRATLIGSTALTAISVVSGLAASGCQTDSCEPPGDSAEIAFASCHFEEPDSHANGGFCCGGQAICLDSSILPAAQRASLAADSCASPSELCVPLELATPGAVPESCRSLGGAEGRCLSECLPWIAASGESLPLSSCAPDMRCAPCFDPLSGGPTGACALTLHDAPEEPSQPLPSCCGGTGRCLASETFDESKGALLGRDSCEAAELCLPVPMFDPKFQPAPCEFVSGSAGVCLSVCLPAVAAQSAVLPSATCGTGELCAPCNDPTTGLPTGFCTP